MSPSSGLSIKPSKKGTDALLLIRGKLDSPWLCFQSAVALPCNRCIAKGLAVVFFYWSEEKTHMEETCKKRGKTAQLKAMIS